MLNFDTRQKPNWQVALQTTYRDRRSCTKRKMCELSKGMLCVGNANSSVEWFYDFQLCWFFPVHFLGHPPDWAAIHLPASSTDAYIPFPMCPYQSLLLNREMWLLLWLLMLLLLLLSCRNQFHKWLPFEWNTRHQWTGQKPFRSREKGVLKLRLSISGV